LNAERGPRLPWARPEVLPYTGDHIPPSRELTAVQNVCLRVADTTTLAIALGTKPQSIAVTTDPSATVDVDPVRAIAGLPLELIEQHEVVHCAVVYGVALHVWERGLPFLVGDWRDERGQLRLCLMLMFGRWRLLCGGLLLLMSGVSILSRRHHGQSQRQDSDGKEE
jgi:hypothetical protein